MYGDSVDLPYRYDLNPDDGSANISDASALELRDVGLNDDRLERRPNWRLIEHDGSVPEVGNRPARPERRGETWIRDYFTIVKAPNVPPRRGGDARRRTEGPQCVGVSRVRDAGGHPRTPGPGGAGDAGSGGRRRLLPGARPGQAAARRGT